MSKRHFRRLVKAEKDKLSVSFSKNDISIEPMHLCSDVSSSSVRIPILQQIPNTDSTANPTSSQTLQNYEEDICYSENIDPTLSQIFSEDDTFSDQNNIIDRQESDLNSKLCHWKEKHNISHNALTDLLKILKESSLRVPDDARTLLKTPRSKAIIKKVEPGEYLHLGVRRNLMAILEHARVNGDTIKLDINVDGLPLSKCSSLCLWPILASIYKNENVKSFIIGAYCGYGKPASTDEFLKDFVHEMTDLEEILDHTGERKNYCRDTLILLRCSSKSLCMWGGRASEF